MYTTIISSEELALHLNDPDWVIVDCRFTLAEPGWGRKSYQEDHIPGAVFADLNEDLSGPVIPGVTGRHPLPSVEEISRKVANWGIGEQVQVVAYDDAGGAMAAARLWWILGWLGHTRRAVLDGGWSLWLREGRPIRSGVESGTPRQFTPHLHPEVLANAEDVQKIRTEPDWRLLDARSAARFRGENEVIDPVAGHIPGAVSAPYTDNLTPDGIFKPVDELRSTYKSLLGGLPAQRAIVYCGSGVVAAHNILALDHAGLGRARLYPGSWSEWITDPNRPVDR